MTQKWSSIRRGTIIRIYSPMNEGYLLIKVTSRQKSGGYGKIIGGKRKLSKSKHYLFNERMFKAGRITIVPNKLAKVLYGD